MKERVLIIEDVGEDCTVLAEKLASQGYKVCSVQTDEEFWDQMRNFPVDLVIFDVCLKKRLSPSVYQALLDLREGQKIPVVLTAGVTERTDRVAALSDENYVFFPEPVDFSQLQEEIQKLLSRGPAVSAA